MRVKDEKLNELFRNLAAEFIGKESNRTSLITVTGSAMSTDRNYATIFFSVMPESKEEEVLNFLKRQGTEFKNFVKSKARVGKLPFFEFKIDMGEKNRQKIDTLLQNDKKAT